MGLNLSNRISRQPTNDVPTNVHRSKRTAARFKPVKAVKKLFYKMCGKEGGLP